MNILTTNSDIKEAMRIEDLLCRSRNDINVINKGNALEDSISLITKENSNIDLAIISIHNLAVNSLITQRINIPLIFTSTLKEDAYEAIKNNCVDFILEPIDELSLSKAIEKARTMLLPKKPEGKKYKRRFIVKYGDKIQSKPVEDVSYIYAEGKMAFIMTKPTNRKYIIEYTLDELEKSLLNPEHFYRINRKFIVNIDAIDEARVYVNSRLKLILNHPTDFDMIVSREKVHDFKNWLNI